CVVRLGCLARPETGTLGQAARARDSRRSLTGELQSAMRRRGEIGSLLLFCAVTLVGAALLVRPFRAKREAFDKASFARLQQRQPEFVLIGDSLLGYSIDQATLESALDGRHVEVLWHGGAASAAWFLYL